MKGELLDLAQRIGRTNGARRAMLLDEMTRLETEGKHCFKCSGVCCTFVANSMQTTPVESLEVLRYLAEEGRLNDALINLLKTTTRRYRLDQPAPGDGRRSFSRRTYTCPFYVGGEKGCSLSAKVKPYGCLGFNAQVSGVLDGGNCSSNQSLLATRAQHFENEENKLNRLIQSRLDLDWAKLPLPLALLALLDANDG